MNKLWLLFLVISWDASAYRFPKYGFVSGVLYHENIIWPAAWEKNIGIKLYEQEKMAWFLEYSEIEQSDHGSSYTRSQVKIRNLFLRFHFLDGFFLSVGGSNSKYRYFDEINIKEFGITENSKGISYSLGYHLFNRSILEGVHLDYVFKFFNNYETKEKTNNSNDRNRSLNKEFSIGFGMGVSI